MKNAVIYGRVSTEDKQDYDRQVDDLTRYAKKNDYKIVEMFTEKISGRAKHRPEFEKMLLYLDNNKDVKNILVTELSRFGRLGTKTKVAIEDLAEKGVNIFFQDRGFNSLQENGKMNSDTMMIIGILCDIAKKEVETLQQRIVSGLRFSASKNGAMSGKYRAYGFKSVDGKMEIDKTEMKVIKEVFDLYKASLGCSQIASHLNGKGVLTRYNKVIGENKTRTKNGYTKKGNDFSWSSGTITTILKNKLYKGERWHKGELVGTFEAPIEPTLFDQVQVIMKGRNNRPIRMITNDNHLKGIIKCGVCGQPYSMHERKDGKDKAYQCLSYKLAYDGKMDFCGSPAIGIPKLLDSLYIVAADNIINKLKSSKSTRLSDTEEKISLKQIEIENIKKEIKKFDNKISKLYDDYNEGIITKSLYISKKNEFENNQKKNEDQLNTMVIDLNQLEDSKKKPVRDYYTYQTFLREIKSVINLVTISTVDSNNAGRTEKVFSKKDTKVQVTVKSVNGQVFTFIISRYSKKLYIVGSKGKVLTTIRPEPFKGAYEILHNFNQAIDKKVKQLR